MNIIRFVAAALTVSLAITSVPVAASAGHPSETEKNKQLVLRAY